MLSDGDQFIVKFFPCNVLQLKQYLKDIILEELFPEGIHMEHFPNCLCENFIENKLFKNFINVNPSEQ